MFPSRAERRLRHDRGSHEDSDAGKPAGLADECLDARRVVRAAREPSPSISAVVEVGRSTLAAEF
jgi:hypothetical protein